MGTRRPEAWRSESKGLICSGLRKRSGVPGFEAWMSSDPFECGMRSAECGTTEMRNAECGVRNY